jgi:hypothetical protein
MYRVEYARCVGANLIVFDEDMERECNYTIRLLLMRPGVTVLTVHEE